MFVDYTRIEVSAGDGGSGAVTFRREKYVPKGGPSGGNGGDGGSVLVLASAHLSSLLPFRYKHRFYAQRGAHGASQNRTGKRGDDLVLEVPVGTQIRNSETDEIILDMQQPGQTEVLAKGGKGGRGNLAFVSPTNQTPEQSQEGLPGQHFFVTLELKVLADVGLRGYPNAGKSTLISVISAARPEIANYPFTTLVPNLGVAAYGEYGSFVVADIPGLIEGAHQGSGLGDRFLRHVERSRVLVHLVDVSAFGPENPSLAVDTIQRELRLYKKELSSKPQILVASKMDIVEEEKVKVLKEKAESQGMEFLTISAVQQSGIKELKDCLAGILEIGSV